MADDEAENPLDVIEAEHDAQSIADAYGLPRELLGDAERTARIKRLRREQAEADTEDDA